MRITSTAFAEGEAIPSRYTCDGVDVSPPLEIEDVPPETVALVVVMDDPDAPRGTWDHWVLYDLPVVAVIEEGAEASGTPGRNSWGSTGYRGPCPPGGTHRYVFNAFAISARTGLPGGADKAAVLEAIEGWVIARATLTGRYQRT